MIVENPALALHRNRKRRPEYAFGAYLPRKRMYSLSAWKETKKTSPAKTNAMSVARIPIMGGSKSCTIQEMYFAGIMK